MAVFAILITLLGSLKLTFPLFLFYAFSFGFLNQRGFRITISLCEKCPNNEFFLVRILMQENADQKKLRIGTLFRQCIDSITQNTAKAKAVNEFMPNFNRDRGVVGEIRSLRSIASNVREYEFPLTNILLYNDRMGRIRVSENPYSLIFYAVLEKDFYNLKI